MAAEMTVTREKLAEYLADPNKFDCGIVIRNSKFILRSIGKTKRHFYPPPQISLFGNGWRKLVEGTEQTSKSTADQPSEQPTSSSASKTRREPKLRFTLGIDTFPALKAFRLDLPSNSNTHTVEKEALYIFSAESYASLKVNMERPAKQDLEFFLSKQMKLIAHSTSQRNRESAKSVSTDFCIRSGSTVALYNKISNHAPCRYVHVVGDLYVPNFKFWSSFTIYHAKDDGKANPLTFNYTADYINFGDTVRLLDSVTGISSPDMRILQVENGRVKLPQSGDKKLPVCERNQCAFQPVGENSYLSLHSDVILNDFGVVDESSHTIKSISTWTIIPIDTTEYRFYEAMGPVPNPVTPAPMITGMEVVKPDGTAIEFKGSNLGAEHKFWLGLYELSRLLLSPERTTFTLPKYDDVLNVSGSLHRSDDGQVSFPITITRSDGVVYGTPYYFSYNKVANGRGEPAMVDPCAKYKHPNPLRRVCRMSQDEISPKKIKLSARKPKSKKSSANSATTE
uniref:SET domain-containing protein n=1 Tax=Panagrellus redivivus TaxID=6233 RepID=A0A7E4V705_PANRE